MKRYILKVTLKGTLKGIDPKARMIEDEIGEFVKYKDMQEMLSDFIEGIVVVNSEILAKELIEKWE